MPGTTQTELAVLAEDLRQAVGGFVRKVRAAADTPRTTWSDTLADLDRAGPATVATLARLRQVRHQSMRVTVSQLEAQGLVARTADATDARSQRVALTGAGQASLAASRTARASWIADALGTQATAAERAALATAIQVLRRLTEGGSGGA